MKKGYTYILSNKNRTVLYVGMTANIYKRIKQHKGTKGYVFTKRYNVNELLYFEEFTNIVDAIAREKQLKNWHKEWKCNLIKKVNPELKELILDKKN